jgi:hypothetical protein
VSPAAARTPRDSRPLIDRRAFLGRTAVAGLGASLVAGFPSLRTARAAVDTTSKRELTVLQ